MRYNAKGDILMRYEIEVGYDHCADGPQDWDWGWKPYSFSNKHTNYKHPDSFDQEELSAKLEKGEAFLLSYYEHSGCVWSLLNELPPGANCRWDSVRMAGVLIWESVTTDLAESLEDRKESARAFIKTYTQWCNGEIYFVSVYEITTCEHCGEEKRELVDSCGGFYDKESIIEMTPTCDGEISITGEASWLLDESDFRK